MISRDAAKRTAAAFAGYPGAADQSAEYKAAFVSAFEQCADEHHAQRAMRMLLDGFRLDEGSARFLPSVADVHAARERTYQEREHARSGCRKCEGSGLWSRDVLLRNGIMAGVCGPCPDCQAGEDRRVADARRQEERQAKYTEQGQQRKAPSRMTRAEFDSAIGG